MQHFHELVGVADERDDGGDGYDGASIIEHRSERKLGS